MFVVRDCVHIRAPLERCFLLSTNLELARRTLGMRPLDGAAARSSGNVVGGDRVLWVGWKFGLPAFHESLITRYEPPYFFQDTMARGRFKRFQHDHQLTEIGGQVLLTETVRFSLPLGRVGRWAGRSVMVPHVTQLLRKRLDLLRRVAESDEWRRYVPQSQQLEVASPALLLKGRA